MITLTIITLNNFLCVMVYFVLIQTIYESSLRIESFVKLYKTTKIEINTFGLFLFSRFKANINILNPESNWKSLCPIVIALGQGNARMVRTLVQLGADVNLKLSKNSNGSDPFLPLHWALSTEKQLSNTF